MTKWDGNALHLIGTAGNELWATGEWSETGQGKTIEEYEAMRAHVRDNDFPETTSQWHLLGREAGFGRVRELFVAPTDLFRMYCFQA